MMNDQERKLPEEFMKEYGPGSSKRIATVFGVQVDDLSREELIAVINFSQSQARADRIQHQRDLSFLGDVRRVART